MARLFENNGFTNAKGMVLPLSDFRLFTDLPNSDTIEDRYKEGIIKRAEALIGKEYPVILATDYMAYTRTGDRTAYSSKTFPKRGDLVSLVNAELVEGQGRFMDSIINLMWMILEESTWVCNAHNRTGEPLSAQYDTEVGGIDLFSATTGASMAYAYYALKDKLNAISPLFCERTLMMLRRRIINPFINAQDDPGNWWMGIGRGTNNWNPWICSNILWVVGVVEDDLSVREKTVTWALSYLDNFINLYAPDGGCDEGPGYWGAAGAAYMDCLEIITDLTAGKILVLFMLIGVALQGLGVYQFLVEFAGAGATVPISGFGYLLANGAIKGAQKGVFGAFTGARTSASAGISAAVIFSFLTAVLFKSKTKKN